MTIITNPCPLCGKQRIVVESYEEVVGMAVMIHTKTACPDPDCQKKLITLLSKEKKKRRKIEADSKRREEERIERVRASRVSSKASKS